MSDTEINVVATIAGILLGLWPLLRTFLNARQVARIEQVAQMAVRAAEVYHRDGQSRDKLWYAIDRAHEISRKYNVRLTDKQWEIQINNAVYDLKRADGELPKTSPLAYPETSLR